jgi:hypothetical protein
LDGKSEVTKQSGQQEKRNRLCERGYQKVTTTNTSAQARRDLQGISSDLKWSAVELARIADRLEAAGNSPDAQAVIRMIQIFQQGEKRLGLIADQIHTLVSRQATDSA